MPIIRFFVCSSLSFDERASRLQYKVYRTVCKHGNDLANRLLRLSSVLRRTPLEKIPKRISLPSFSLSAVARGWFDDIDTKDIQDHFSVRAVFSVTFLELSCGNVVWEKHHRDGFDHTLRPTHFPSTKNAQRAACE